MKMAEKTKPDSIEAQLPFSVSIIITEKNSKPCLEIRRVTTDEQIIKDIIRCAFHNQPIIVLPQFTDRMRSISSLVDKGILIKEGDNMYFTF